MNSRFVYESFAVQDDGRTVDFTYRIEREGAVHELRETLTFPVQLPDTGAIASTLRALHLALGVSYYKIFVPQAIAQPYAMDDDEAAFWNGVWQGGLGEFMYVNDLPASRLAKFSAQDGSAVSGQPANATEARALLGIGGGKDSALAGELLKSLSVPVEGFVMATGEQLGQAQAVAGAMGVPLHVVERRLDQQLLALQEQPGAFKGHIPISLIFGLVGTILAASLGSAYVVVANEASASLPRIEGQNGAVNHQWSKSYGFETQLQAYIHQHVAQDIHYFSAIRQLTSVGVAKLFTQYSAYFTVFTSDNFVFRINPAKRPHARWSLESPKSLSSFMLLAPWLDEATLLEIFGRNFLNETSLSELSRELLGVAGEPPLDCVGTVEELVLSMNLVAQQGKFADSSLLALAHQDGVIRESDWAATLQTMLALQPEEALPEILRAPMTNFLAEKLAA